MDEEGIIIINNEELVPERLHYLCSLFNSTQEEFEQWIQDVLKAQEDSTMHEHKPEHQHTEDGECCAHDEDEEDEEVDEDDDDAMDMSEDDEDSEIEDVPIKIADLKGVTDLMLEVLKKRLSLYSTSLEEDEIQLTQLKSTKNNSNNGQGSTDANPRLYSALVVRISEKRLLNAAMNKISSN